MRPGIPLDRAVAGLAMPSESGPAEPQSAPQPTVGFSDGRPAPASGGQACSVWCWSTTLLRRATISACRFGGTAS